MRCVERDAVEARGHFVQDGRSAGNENRRWHGTTRECRLGDSQQTQFCSSSSCSLCCIMKTSYDLNLWGKKTGWGRYVMHSSDRSQTQADRLLLNFRFGAGIYTSSTSSKYVLGIDLSSSSELTFHTIRSNDYSSSLDPKTSLKAILLNKIVVGKGYKMTQDNTTLTAPPAGYDSVSPLFNLIRVVVILNNRAGPCGERVKTQP